MNSVRNIYKTIEYTVYGDQKPNVFLFIPSASRGESPPLKLIELLLPYGSVIYLNSGYFGISRTTNLNWNSYSQSNFVDILFDLIKKSSYSNICIIAGSVGAIHAIQLIHKYSPKNITHLVMGAPAFRKYKPIKNFIYISIINLLILLYPEKLFSIYLKLLPYIPVLSHTYSEMSWVYSQIGARSYMLCLKEIIQFSKNRLNILQIIKNIGTVIVGEKDSYFNILCDSKLCEQTTYYKLKCGHGVLMEQPKKVFQIIIDSCNFPQVGL